MFNFFKKEEDSLQKEWYKKGEDYAVQINKMVDFGEKNGWENWEGTEPVDDRSNLASQVFSRLKDANINGTVAKFRELFPPAHAPFIDFLENKSQSIEQICFIENQKVVFVTGTAYQTRQAYLLTNDKVLELDESIVAIGKSKQQNVFAIAAKNTITTFKGWQGDVISEFTLDALQNIGITTMIPFNDGLKVLVTTASGIFLLSQNEEKLIYPIKNEEDEKDDDWTSDIAMENATISNNNKYIVVGEQCDDHHVLDANGNVLGTIGPQSSYPHYCLFSKDDSQLITNSCHFYNGITIGVDTKNLEGIEVEPYTESDHFVYINEEMRVYAAVSLTDYYILGDAYGYIKAFDKAGKQIWRHFLGSTISSMEISEDESTLWVGSFSGMLHKLTLGKEHRDTHTIGNGKLYENFRLIFWKEEPQVWKW